MLSQECAEVTPTMCMQVNVDINFVSVWKMWSFGTCDTGKDINCEDENPDTIQYQEGFQIYVGNEFCAKHWPLPFH
jgi:hypothetical protein